MKAWTLLAVLSVLGRCAAAALAACPAGVENEIFCDDFDTYCVTGGGYPGDPKCDPETASKNNALVRSVWRRISANEGDGSAAGAEFNIEDIQENLSSLPFGVRCTGQPQTTLGLQSFRDWTQPGDVFEMSRLIGQTFNSPGHTYQAVAGSNDRPLVMQFLLSAGTSQKLYWSSGYMELAFVTPNGPPYLERANTDYAIVPCTCAPLPTGSALQVICAQGNPSAALPERCPAAATAPVRRAIAVGALTLLDPQPCKCNGSWNAGYSEQLALFDGKVWWTLRENDPMPSSGTVTPKDEAPMPPPDDIHLPGSFRMNGGDAGVAAGAKALNWLILTVRADTLKIEMVTEELSKTNGSTYYVSHVMDNIPRQYMGPFNTIHGGVGGNCPLQSNTDWTTCVMNPNYPARTALYLTGTKSYYVDFDDVVLHAGEGYSVPGACCLPDNTCTETTVDECVAAEGTFRGASTTCATADCLGACCQPRGVCTQTLPADCSGRYRGVGTDCDLRACCPSPFADFDWDGDVDSVDFAILQRCITGEGVTGGCTCFDRNGDDVIDVYDADAFVACATGPEIDAVLAGCD